jgi:outer membrane immunogenic protein
MSIPITPTRLQAGQAFAAVYLLTATIALVCASTVVSAADMAMPMKAPEPPAYLWTGCYVGANVGGGTSATNFGTGVDPGTYLAPPDPGTVSADGSGSRNSDGILAGGTVGCNWQTGTVVLGLEGDYDYFHSNPNLNNNSAATGISLANGNPLAINQSLTTNFLATVRPRIGIAADRNFAYITGGVAFTGVSYSESYVDGNAPPGTGVASASRALVGYAAGAGWEYAFADHWTARAEYLFVGFPTTNATGTIAGLGGTNTLHGSADLTIQLIRAGVNFKF